MQCIIYKIICIIKRVIIYSIEVIHKVLKGSGIFSYYNRNHRNI